MTVNLAGGVVRHFEYSGYSKGAATFDAKLRANVAYSFHECLAGALELVYRSLEPNGRRNGILPGRQVCLPAVYIMVRVEDVCVRGSPARGTKLTRNAHARHTTPHYFVRGS